MIIGLQPPSNAFDVLIELIGANREIAALELATLNFAPLIDERAKLQIADVGVVERALQLRSELELPFWDGLMLAAGTAVPMPIAALQGALFHQSLAGTTAEFDVGTLSTDALATIADNARQQSKFLAVTSTAHLRDGTIGHLALLDFHLAYSERATQLLAEIMSAMRMPGTLLCSGKSYHFYGSRLLSQHELVPFLGRALLFAPIVDRTWIAHQLIEGRCALRLSPRDDYGGAPTVVYRVKAA